MPALRVLLTGKDCVGYKGSRMLKPKRRTKVNTILLDGAKRRCKGLCVGGGANVLQDECQALRMLN